MERSYESWSSCEEGLLLLRLAEKTSLDCIATEFGRSVGAIRARRDLIAFRLFKKGRSMRDLTIMLDMTYSDLENMLRRRF
jgi:hypothetical protein